MGNKPSQGVPTKLGTCRSPVMPDSIPLAQSRRPTTKYNCAKWHGATTSPPRLHPPIPLYIMAEGVIPEMQSREPPGIAGRIPGLGGEKRFGETGGWRAHKCDTEPPKEIARGD